MPDEHFAGHANRECGEHRTSGRRAWCFDDSEWCYPDIPCRGCELPALRRRAEQAERERDAARQALAAVQIDRDQWRDLAWTPRCHCGVGRTAGTAAPSSTTHRMHREHPDQPTSPEETR